MTLHRYKEPRNAGPQRLFHPQGQLAGSSGQAVAACRKYLTGHAGSVFFAAGTRAANYDRPVNDRDFDVALQVVFADNPSHDRYQRAERHLTFVAENKDNWERVRVFDACVESDLG